MTIADTALAAADNLTTLASSVSSGDAAAALALAKELTASAAEWNAQQARLATLATALTAAQSAVSRAVRAVEIVVNGADGGALAFGAAGTTSTRIQAAIDAARRYRNGADMADAATSTRDTWSAATTTRSAAESARRETESTITIQLARATALTDYLTAI